MVETSLDYFLLIRGVGFLGESPISVFRISPTSEPAKEASGAVGEAAATADPLRVLAFIPTQESPEFQTICRWQGSHPS